MWQVKAGGARAGNGVCAEMPRAAPSRSSGGFAAGLCGNGRFAAHAVMGQSLQPPRSSAAPWVAGNIGSLPGVMGAGLDATGDGLAAARSSWWYRRPEAAAGRMGVSRCAQPRGCRARRHAMRAVLGGSVGRSRGGGHLKKSQHGGPLTNIQVVSRSSMRHASGVKV